jgi:hypothetical protein
VIAEGRFSAPPDCNRQPDDRQLWLIFCQYSTGAKLLIGLVVILAICRGGKGAWRVHPCSVEKKIARRWQKVLPANLRSISHAHQ